MLLGFVGEQSGPPVLAGLSGGDLDVSLRLLVRLDVGINFGVQFDFAVVIFSFGGLSSVIQSKKLKIHKLDVQNLSRSRNIVYFEFRDFDCEQQLGFSLRPQHRRRVTPEICVKDHL